MAKLLKIIQGLIYKYNKLGKVKKLEGKIVERIHSLCNNYVFEEKPEEWLNNGRIKQHRDSSSNKSGRSL